MELRRLRVLVELYRLGTMSAVAQATGYGTSAVSQQLAALEREAGVPLLEADGRRVRLTPAGRRLVGHAEGILAAMTAAELDLAAAGQPRGLVRVAGFTTALRRHLLPVAGELARIHPLVELEIQEREPTEVDELLDADQIDVGFVYDYTLVPRGGRHIRSLLGHSPMMLAVPPDSAGPARRMIWRTSVTRPGSATRATQATTSSPAGSAPWPDGRRGSGTARTAWN